LYKTQSLEGLRQNPEIYIAFGSRGFNPGRKEERNRTFTDQRLRK
jgi:hypothetical protein